MAPPLRPSPSPGLALVLVAVLCSLHLHVHAHAEGDAELFGGAEAAAVCAAAVGPTARFSDGVGGVGIRKERKRAADAYLKGLVEERGVPKGAVMMAERHGDVYVGLSDKESATEASLFRICSLTKAIVSVAALAYVQDGELDLRSPASELVPELGQIPGVVEKCESAAASGCKSADGQPSTLHRTVPLARPITAWHLLTHTAGFTYGFFGPQHFNSSHNDPRTHIVASHYYPLVGVYDGCQSSGVGERAVSPVDNVANLAKAPLVSQPGERMSYGLSTDVLGVLLQRLEQRIRRRADPMAALPSLEEVLTARVFAPLGMNETFFHVDAKRAIPLAPLHHLPGRNARSIACDDANAAATPEYCRSHARAVRVEPGDDAPRMQSGGCGLLSTPRDYLKFVRFLADATAPEARRAHGEAAPRSFAGDRPPPASLVAMRRALLVDRLDAADWPFRNVGATNRGFGWNMVGHLSRNARTHDADEMLVAPDSQLGKGLHGLLYFVDGTSGLAAVFFVQCHGFSKACFEVNQHVGATFPAVAASLSA